mmetsp:Transcript_40109/g.99129  ORF Transcript_40109/g.99129 Transcript_40109/m.99129 type:complete len:208 (+) Transcript_40109:362-985(+)
MWRRAGIRLILPSSPGGRQWRRRGRRQRRVRLRGQRGTPRGSPGRSRRCWRSRQRSGRGCGRMCWSGTDQPTSLPDFPGALPDSLPPLPDSLPDYLAGRPTLGLISFLPLSLRLSVGPAGRQALIRLVPCSNRGVWLPLCVAAAFRASSEQTPPAQGGWRFSTLSPKDSYTHRHRQHSHRHSTGGRRRQGACRVWQGAGRWSCVRWL